MKLNKLLSICLGITLAFSVSANDLSEARIYINPGHGGWGPNDRPMATINYAQMDTLGFFETNTNLIKGMALREELVKAGAGYVRMLYRPMMNTKPKTTNTSRLSPEKVELNS